MSQGFVNAISGQPVEQGTWTPEATFATPGDLSVMYSAQTGNYIKIGNLVYISVSLNFTPTYTTSSGGFLISGIPYPAESNSSGLSFAAAGVTTNFVFPTSTTMLLASVATSIQLWGVGSAVATSPVTTTHIPTGDQQVFVIGGSYITA